VKAVIDTNVLVSALLSPFGAPGRVLDLVIGSSLQTAFDDRILAEYRSVLMRAKFGFEARAVDDLLTFVALTGAAVAAPVLAVDLPDPSDAMFVEVAVGAGCQIITGNQRHFPREQCRGVAVLTPGEFITWWQTQGQSERGKRDRA
jgi:putative PIN family toxin of toxin-antitoxin system